jgi:hypothetical protein
MVYRQAKPQGTLLKEFREHVVKGHGAKQIVDDILMPMAEVYEELTGSSYSSTERAEAINESLKWLNRLEFNDWLPPALAFAVRWRAQPAAMEDFFRDLERVAYFMLITRAGINDRIERFLRLTKEIEAGGNTQTLLPEYFYCPGLRRLTIRFSFRMACSSSP